MKPNTEVVGLQDTKTIDIEGTRKPMIIHIPKGINACKQSWMTGRKELYSIENAQPYKTKHPN